MKKLNTLKELKTLKNYYKELQYKNRSMSLSKINDYELKQVDASLQNEDIWQIWSYNTIIGYYNSSNNQAIFTSKKYSQTTSKQITQLINENDIKKQTIEKTFANWNTIEDLTSIKHYLLGGEIC